ncbi:MAG: FtsW/RodA/SpoVE family cell cycle protein, partial [Tissierellia bacterium]|nr:FtsW/RodA/SpoVE family cell cycle protein [Tissierellia bacterium]
MINKVTKLRKPRNLLLMFDILAIGMLMLYKDPSSNRNMGILASALIILLYVSNIILERV